MTVETWMAICHETCDTELDYHDIKPFAAITTIADDLDALDHAEAFVKQLLADPDTLVKKNLYAESFHNS